MMTAGNRREVPSGWHGQQARGVLDPGGDEITGVLARLQQTRGTWHSEQEALR